jgi:hypothetical protein
MLLQAYIALGWTPTIACVEDGTRRVLQIVAWTGGNGDAPANNTYLGPLGTVVDINDATDVASLKDATLTYIIDGGGSEITTGLKDYIEVPYDCTITGWTILGNETGSIVVDVWKDSFANFPPLLADSIAGTEKPTITGDVKGQNLSLSDFDTSLLKGDILAFNVDSVTDIKKVTISFRIIKA